MELETQSLSTTSAFSKNKLITHSPKILKKVQDFLKLRMAKGSDADHPFPILLRPFVRNNLLYSNEI